MIEYLRFNLKSYRKWEVAGVRDKISLTMS